VKHTAPELLLPAGSLAKMRAAYDFGADAVYAGQPRYSLRARNNEFRLEQIAQGIAEAHARGKKFFVTSNLIAHNDKVRTYLRDIEPVIALKPDALIMADPGLIMQVHEKWPEVPIHLSVQANTTNWATVKFWQKMGVSRIILSRELSLDEVEGIRNECPDMELEVFVHGALCIAYSGRCLLSGYFNRRDPNQGTCTNACRWEYGTQAPASTRPAARRCRWARWSAISTLPRLRPKRRQLFDLRRRCPPPGGRPGLFPRGEGPSGRADAHHGRRARHLHPEQQGPAAVEHVARLCQIGVDSLKIEGRTKSLYYVARTAQVYRRAIDDAMAGRPSTRSCCWSWKAWPTAATPVACWSAARRRTTRTTSAATANCTAAISSARCWACAPTAGPRWRRRTASRWATASR
jgi:putative protease